ncbi:ComEA family DNA-binding protein [Streptomyces sp. NPDC002033]|uniref:ComEA family DNA-binding protein n=1 Tax=Streptomyces sp. NPDC002033 TaxID=3154533 RepID=UPI00332F9601
MRERRRAGPDPAVLRRRAEALLGGAAPPGVVGAESGAGAGAGAGAEAGGVRVADPPGDVEPWLGAYPRAWPEPAGAAAGAVGAGVAGGPPDEGGGGERPVERAARGPEPGGGAVEAGAGASAGAFGGAGVREGVGGVAAGAGVPGGWRLGVRERLPVWLQARCGVEPRTVAAVAVVLAAAVGFAAQQYWSGRPQAVTAPAVVAPVSAAASAVPVGPGSATAGTRIVVDVGGKVREPGVRRLPGGSRVQDALTAAGGVRPGTDTTGLNLARVLVDGEQVLVGATAQPAPGGGGPGGGPPGPGPLSLATATVEQLDGLPGVGPVLARHIVDFRTARGGFRGVEDLRQVDGIGERRFADLRGLVRP